MSPVYRFSCGHIGRSSEARWSKATGFIRVAEIRNAPLRIDRGPCPDCKAASQSRGADRAMPVGQSAN